MKRRNLLFGVGGTTATALAIGTGAFSAARVGRHAAITVSPDTDGLVGLVPNPSVAGVRLNSPELTIDLDAVSRGAAAAVTAAGGSVKGAAAEESA